MRFLVKLFAGDVTLWCTLWLIATPLAIFWDVNGGCILTGCKFQLVASRVDLIITGFLIGLFALSNVGVAAVSVAIWHGSSKQRREVWWERLLAFGVKLYAALTGSAAFVILLVILYDLIHHAMKGHA